MNYLNRKYRYLILISLLSLSCYSYSPVILKYKLEFPGKIKGSPKYIIKRSKKYLVKINRNTLLARINNTAVGLALEGKFSEAEVLFKDLISEKPDDSAPYNNLGVIYELFDYRKKAFEMYSTACIKDPDNYYFRHNFITFVDSRKK